MSTFLNDICCFEESLQIADTNIFYQNVINDMRGEIFGEKYKESIHYAKCLSQKGQVLAFLRKSEAEECFLSALKYMENNSANQLITMSYLLHFYMDQGKKKEYDVSSITYFGGFQTLKEQFDY
ncbi:MAG: hypothetical protein Q4B70_15960, partial [Lachnospiraceae bacterium]|nr:hypothetical protein [Lachnospiraceae bacterium]